MKNVMQIQAYWLIKGVFVNWFGSKWQAFCVQIGHGKLGNNCYHTTFKYLVFGLFSKVITFYAPVKSFCPHPPRGHHFFGVVLVSLSLYFSLAPPYINTIVTPFSSAPHLLITHIFLWPRGCPRGDGGRTIWPVH